MMFLRILLYCVGTAHNFVKLSNAAVSTQGITYDTGSIMHYSAYAFSKNGKPTIVAQRGVSANRMGQRVKFTSQDVQHINALYCDPSEHKPCISRAHCILYCTLDLQYRSVSYLACKSLSKLLSWQFLPLWVLTSNYPQ